MVRALLTCLFYYFYFNIIVFLWKVHFFHIIIMIYKYILYLICILYLYPY